MAQRRGRAAMDLKLSVLSALNKLADRDTQQIATDELGKIAESLQPDGIPVLLGCIYEISSEQKSVVRREGVKLLALLAALYEDLLTPHLQKIVSSLVRRLKEPDSNIRDACVDAFGSLVAHVPAPAALANGSGGADQVAFSGPVGVFTKPLFDSLNEQARNVQIGAAMSLSRALDNARDLPPACTQRMCFRILKFLNSPNFSAKPALLPALGGLSRASGGAVIQHLGIVISCLQESLQSSDWATRKAAADTFGAVALSVGGPPLISFKSSTMALLDSYRFDKVKPARESVVDAIHIWKNVPDPPVVDASPTRTVSTKSNDSASALKAASNRRHLTGDSRSCSPTVSVSSVSSHSLADKGSSVKKKSAQPPAAAAVADRKTNLDFFRKLSIRNSDDWQIEVAVPRGSPPASHNKENHEEIAAVQQQQQQQQQQQLVEKMTVVQQGRNNGSSESHEEKEKLGFKALVDKFEGAESVKAREDSSGKIINHVVNGWCPPQPQQQQQQQQHNIQPNQQQVHEAGVVKPLPDQQRRPAPGSDLLSIGRQLSQLEKGQSELMEMLQEFMGSSQDNTASLELRVQRLERALEDMARIIPRHGGNFFSSNESNELSKVSENGSFADRPMTWGGETVFRPTNRGRYQPEPSSDMLETSKRNWESRLVGRLGEGPSARSVWRASKDEATLAAIRVAGAGDGPGVYESDKLLPSSARSTEAVSSKNSEQQQQQQQQQQANSWNVWGRVMEFLQSGDLDCAYEEVICSGDELLLVRLMNRTGPVVEQLSSETVGELLRSISLFLQQPSFVDAAMPWLRQVTEMVRTNGPKCLGVSAEVKKEMVASMHECSMVEFPERWMGSAVSKMANQLGNSWLADLQA